jgi:hypothetical protein
MLQPEKLATPAVVVSVQPDSVPLFGLVPMERATDAVEEVTTLPYASSTDTATLNLVPAVELAGGWAVTMSWLGLVTTMVNDCETDPVLLAAVTVIG